MRSVTSRTRCVQDVRRRGRTVRVPSAAMWVAIVAMVAGSLVVAEVGRRGAAGTLPRNHLAGIRVPATMRDDTAWARGHRAGGPVLVATGLAGALVGIAAWPVEVAAGPAAAAGVVLAAAVLLVVGVVVAARRAAAAGGER
nr:SdpI family protein [Thermoanaerobacterales bacterium]